MEDNFQNFLNDKNKNNQSSRQFKSFKRIVLIVILIIIAFILFSFTKFLLDKTSSLIIKKSNGPKRNITKHNDEYYLNLVDEYYDKVNTASLNNVINSYDNLGVVKCSGYINFRSEPNEKDTRSIIGLMNNGDALDILEWDLKNSDIYCKVKSGGMTGYVAKQYVMTGDNAIAIAKEKAAVRAIVLADKLRMRSEPNTDTDNVIGRTYKGERYKLVSLSNGWAKVEADNIEDAEYGYLSADSKYLEIKYCLSEARKQDLKSDVLNFYDNLGVCTAKDYMNVRKTAKANGAIIGKLPKHAGCEILGESGQFYKIKSGKVTGYVSKQYLASGKRAEDLALTYADLRAIIKIAALKVRSGPGTKYKQWTTIRKEETYIVTNQLDGWVEIEIDEGSDKGYISTQNNYVEVRYALDQAVEFHPVSTNVSSTRGKLKATAVKYVGGSYVWGGNNLSSGVDCSGFVQQIYKMFGITMKRVAREQAKQGVEVSSGNKKVGDLIFYANSNGVIDHVAIYIGNNQIVHAASTKAGIKISNWDYRTPKCIRNVLGNK